MVATSTLNRPVGQINLRTSVYTSVANPEGVNVLNMENQGVLKVSAASAIAVRTTDRVTLPAATFSSTGAGFTSLNAAGDASLTTLDATALTATVTFAAASVIGGHVLEAAAKVVNVRSDLNCDSIRTNGGGALRVVNATLQLGGDTVTDADNDGSGICIPGVPDFLPEGTEADALGHCLKWERRNGDFDTAGNEHPPHRKPRWVLGGGCLEILSSDENDAATSWFFAPTNNGLESVLGIYHSRAGGDVELVHQFNIPMPVYVPPPTVSSTISELSALSDGDPVTEWGAFSAAAVGSFPVYDAAGRCVQLRIDQPDDNYTDGFEVRLPGDRTLQITGAGMSVCIRVNIHELSDDARVFEFGGSLDDDRRFYLKKNDATGNIFVVAAGTATLFSAAGTDQWLTLTLTYDAVTGRTVCYADGEVLTSFYGAVWSGDEPFEFMVIGRGTVVNMDVAEFTVWMTTLSYDQVREHWLSNDPMGVDS